MATHRRTSAERVRPRFSTTFVHWLTQHSRLLLVLMIGSWASIFAIAAVYKLNSWWMGFDLGTHEQVAWNTIHGRFAASSPSRGTDSYFGVDIIITELLLTPFYALRQSPATLLVIQAVLASLGAWPLFLLGRKLLSPLAGLAIAALYLLSLPVQYATLYEYQIRVVGTVSFLWAWWFYEERRSGWFWGFLLLALGTRSEAGFVVAGLGVYALLDRRRWTWSWAVIATGLGWVGLTNAVLIPFFRNDHISMYAFLYGWLGATPSEMLITLITRPGYVLENVLTSGKLEYLLQLIGPLLGLSVLRPKLTLIGLPSLALNLLSPDRIHWSIRYHYQAFIIPWLLLAAVYALVDMRQRGWRWWPWVLGVLVLAHIGANLIWRSPLQTIISRDRDTERIALLQAMVAELPPNEPVTVSSQFGPFVAQRQGLYYFPGNIVYPRAYIERGHWILVDRAEIPADCMQRLDVLLASERWEVIRDEGGIVVLHDTTPQAAPQLLQPLPTCAVEPEGTP